MLTLKKGSIKYKDSDGSMKDLNSIVGKEVTDASLSKSGVPADAKEVGDRFSQFSQDLKVEVENQLDGVKADIVMNVISQIGGMPVFGTVNDDNTITVTSTLANGEYILMYENESGTLEEIGTITVGDGEITDGYTNIIDTFGYSDGYRLSTSSGGLSAQDGYTTTGLMTIPSGSTIRTKGVNFNYNSSYCNIGVYDSSGTKISTNNLIGQGTTVWNGLTWSFDSEGNLLMNYEISTGQPIYIKLSGYGSGENLIVTINEEIV